MSGQRERSTLLKLGGELLEDAAAMRAAAAGVAALAALSWLLDRSLNPYYYQVLVLIAVLDNLVKGAAGQAVQNFNVIYGFDETTGLL